MVKIVCEGKSDKNKLKEILVFLDIDCSDDNFIVMGNKSTIFKENDDRYKTLTTLIKAQKIEKILFIVDADYQKDNSIYGGYYNTENALDILIEKLNIKSMSSFYISCNPLSKDGYLESLLLSTVDENLKVCYDEFLDCIEFEEKNHHKYIMEQLHKITSPKKPYDLEHPYFRELIGKLSNLFKEV
ncbi:MAG: hypothetical protein Q9M39_01340 [Sulfurovum sp.]|nr:hypothetical protein [Sulfurovum sp.]